MYLYSGKVISYTIHNLLIKMSLLQSIKFSERLEMCNFPKYTLKIHLQKKHNIETC